MLSPRALVRGNPARTKFAAENFQKSQSFEKLHVSIPPSGNTELFNYSIMAAYGLAPTVRLLETRAKPVQTSHL